MKSAKILTILVVALGLIVCQVKVSEAAPMGTAFTYQGHLYDNNNVADGLYDFQFKLYDANSGGSKIGGDINEPDLDVIDGYFTVELDFGGVFDGNAVWLEIGVRPGELEDPNVYAVLEPRQEVTPTPYAIYAKTAGDDNDWMVSGNDMYSIPSGKVGIGTTGPGHLLDIAESPYNVQASLRLRDQVGRGLIFYSPAVTKAAKITTDGTANDLYIETSGGDLILNPDGNVGIGTTGPGAKLEVSGQIKINGGSPGAGKVLTSDASGLASWQTPAGGGDNLGNHIATQNIELNGHWLSGDGGNKGVFVNSAGNVGIGTTGPQKKLHVLNGDVRFETDIAGSSFNLNFKNTAREWNVGTDSSPDHFGIFDVTANSARIIIDASGNVGIGTTSPNQNLDIYESTSGAPVEGAILGISGTADSSDYVGIRMGYLPTSHLKGGIFFERTGDNAVGSLHFATNNEQNSDDADLADVRMTILSSGNVGIGTTGPQNKLDVEGTVAIGASYSGTETAPTNGMIVQGNVGIGTASPQETLDVSGAINTDSVYKIGTNTVLSTLGSYNTFVGKAAGSSNTGSYNAFLGYSAGYSNIAGSSNTFLGHYAGRDHTGGSSNTFLGYYAGYSHTTGGSNTFLGTHAGHSNTTGTGNVFIGREAGYNETGSDKLYIANSTGTPLIYGDFSTNRIGIDRVPTANTFEVEGNASKTTAGDWLANSDERIKTNVQTVTDALETLDKVRLVSFKYTEDYKAKHPSIEKRRYLNVIAQEFRQVFPEYVKSSKEKLTNGEEILQVDAYPLTVYSAAAVQELHAMAKDKDIEIATLKARLTAMEVLVTRLAQRQEGGQQ